MEYTLSKLYSIRRIKVDMLNECRYKSKRKQLINDILGLEKEIDEIEKTGV